jgi:hypothetical protein
MACRAGITTRPDERKKEWRIMTIFEGAAILGALAWTPYLFKLIKDMVTRPKIRIIVQRTAEIGFITFGPILNIRIAFLSIFSICNLDKSVLVGYHRYHDNFIAILAPSSECYLTD